MARSVLLQMTFLERHCVFLEFHIEISYFWIAWRCVSSKFFLLVRRGKYPFLTWLIVNGKAGNEFCLFSKAFYITLNFYKRKSRAYDQSICTLRKQKGFVHISYFQVGCISIWSSPYLCLQARLLFIIIYII